MGALVTNNAAGTLASSISAVTTTVIMNSGQGALFPQPTGADYFYVTISDNSFKEVVKVTARSVNTLTVVRGQDNTTARAFAISDRVELRPVAALHNNYAQKDSANTFVGDQTITGNTATSGNAKTGGVQSVDGAAATNRAFDFTTAALTRWRMRANNVAESGANAGSNFFVDAYNDAGAFLASALSIVRSTGVISVLSGFTIGADKADHFPAGTKMLFVQTAAPAGWTKLTTDNDAAIRIVSGTASRQATAGNEFLTLFSSRGISQGNLPNYTLPDTLGVALVNGTLVARNIVSANLDGGAIGITYPLLSATITASITGSVTSGGSGIAMNFNVNYLDVIQASKD